MAVMQISRKIDYALRAAIHLAMRSDDHRPSSVTEIAAREGIPKKFLEKIIQDLIHHGLVRSTRGAQGGYTLARAPEMVTFQDVIEAIEGPVSLNVCVGAGGDGHECTVFPHCGMLWVWQEAQKRVMDLFASTTLADVRARAVDVSRVLGSGTRSPGEYARPSSV
jgi:Rrf2 family protein